MSVVVVTNKKHFEELIKTKPKVAVDFKATWCGPCKVIGPKFAKLAETHKDVTFLQVDVDDVSEVAQIQRITAMPTFKFFANGKPFEKRPELVGANLSELIKSLTALSEEKLAKEEPATAPKPAEKETTPVEAPKKDAAAPVVAAVNVKKTEAVAAPVVDKAPVVADKPPAAAPAALRWDEDNLKATEEQKDSKMKVDEPPTPYIRYNPELDADLQEMEDLKLASDMSSRSSSVASSPKHAHIVAPKDWISESEEEEGATGADKAKHEQFRKLRRDHYRSEGQYVHKETSDAMDSDDSDDDDEHGASSDDGAHKTGSLSASGCTNGTASGLCAKPGVYGAKGSKATYDQEDSRNFNVDEANAANMEM
ncbi:glycerol ether metabolic process [Coemansia furcata]|nr:glycerol ether metabolic process [Coemansia furcata]